jgi:MFS family permease
VIRRFSLYGFLKNQQYYDPFIVLAFLQMGLNYTLIGTLIAFREVMINLMEIPTGTIADITGRRRAMILSFAAYIVSFALLGSAGAASMRGLIGLPVLLPLLFVAMVFFAIGEAFRSGTHKAMIFTWLRLRGRVDERTKVYGYTRSWSKIGSAVSVVLACVFVFTTRNYVYVFFFSIVPYLVNIVNFMGYPREVDGDAKAGTSLRELLTHLRDTMVLSVTRPGLRRLILESMGFEGFFGASKDYLQPVLKSAALPLAAALFAGVRMSEEQQAVVLIGPVYFALFLLSAWASRKAHVVLARAGHEDAAARTIWTIALAVLTVLLVSTTYGILWATVTAFVALHILQNLWVPVQISRFDTHGDEERGATILSVESQARSIATMVFAPALGFAVDLATARSLGATPFWPVALLGAALALLILLTSRRSPSLPAGGVDQAAGKQVAPLAG